MSLPRNVTGREFQKHGPATEKLLSPRRVRVLLVAHVKTSADRSYRRPMSVTVNVTFVEYRAACGHRSAYLYIRPDGRTCYKHSLDMSVFPRTC